MAKANNQNNDTPEKPDSERVEIPVTKSERISITGASLDKNVFFPETKNDEAKMISTFNMVNLNRDILAEDIPLHDESLSRTAYNRPPTANKLKKDNSKSEQPVLTARQSEKLSKKSGSGKDESQLPRININSRLPLSIISKYSSTRKIPGRERESFQSGKNDSRTINELSHKEVISPTLIDQANSHPRIGELIVAADRRESKISACKSPSSLHSNIRLFGQTKESDSLGSRPVTNYLKDRRPKKLNLKQEDSDAQSHVAPEKSKSKKKHRPYESVRKSAMKFSLSSSLKRSRQFSFNHQVSGDESSSETSPAKQPEPEKPSTLSKEAQNLV
jgi:hypothetical protein